MKDFFYDLTKEEQKLLKELHSPKKIQDYLETIPANFEEDGDTLLSFRNVILKKKAHCLEGALFAAATLWYHGEPPIIMDLQPGPKDDGHTVALYKKDGLWGAISKTNHAVLRFRDPVYRTPRELAMSYFHEYFLDSGLKTLRTYTVFNLKKIKQNWILDMNDVWYIDTALDQVKYISLISSDTARILRNADPVEIDAGKLTVWKKKIM